MNSTVRIVFALACLVVGIVLCVVSFTVRNDEIAWYSQSGVLLILISGVLLRRGFRRDDTADDFHASDTSGVQRRLLLVLLRRSSARLDAATLEAAARNAWEQSFGRNRDGSDFVESGQEGIGFVVQAHGNAFMVLETEKGVRDLNPPAQAHPESAMAIWSEYSYELSIGVVFNYDTDERRLCAYVARLGAALIDSETIGLLHPDSEQVWRVDGDMGERLKAAPESFFAEKGVRTLFNKK